AARLLVEFSEDRGLHYSPATVVGETESIPATAEGISLTLSWRAANDLSVVDQSDLRIRVTPTSEVSSDVGTAAVSTVFGLGENSPPVVHAVTAPAGVQGGSIAIPYSVSDANRDVVGVQLEVSVNGNPWIAATAGTAGDGATTVETDTDPSDRVVYWNAQEDLEGTVSSNVVVRITPVDVTLGTAAESAPFSVNLVAPRITKLTVGEIPGSMNGSIPFVDFQGETVDFEVAIPPSGFRLSLGYVAGFGGADLDFSTLSVTANRSLGPLALGSNLAPWFAPGAEGGTWLVGSEHAIGFGPVTFTATITDQLGNVSDPTRLTVTVVTASSGYRPFNVADGWWLDFERDLFTTTYTGGAFVTITTQSTGNGVPDFDEDLEILGLRTLSPTPGCAALGSNTRLRNWVIAETKGRLDEMYGREFDGSGPGYNPNLTFSLTPAGTRSTIRIGGDDLGAGYTLGRAQFDYRNAGGNHNATVTLGVFTTNMIQFYVNNSYSFRDRFDALIPGRGVPAGEHALDHLVLGELFDRLDHGNDPDHNARYDDIAGAIDALARSTAAVLAHEIGHSLGLCANDPPPLGLFGGVNEPSFAGPYTTPYHFDSPGNNIMAAALSFSTAMISTSSGYRFNELNEAYLREWIILE
ncbi:MAG: hypothetical protein AAF488_16830, partial [Planctomycetota bacterium]